MLLGNTLMLPVTEGQLAIGAWGFEKGWCFVSAGGRKAPTVNSVKS